MLSYVKLALRLSSTTFDNELNNLISAAYLDLGIAGVTDVETDDPLIIRAVCTFCKMHFDDANYDRLKQSYDEQKAQLSMDSDHTDYSDYEE